MSKAIFTRNQRLVASIGKDASLLVDAQGEAENNVQRNELEFLRINLRSCAALARRIERRSKSKTARQLLSATSERNSQ